MNALLPYLKAVAAFVVVLSGNLIFAVNDASAGGSTITGNEWVAAALTTLAATGGVWGVPNLPSKKTPPPDDTPHMA